jgi:cytochrome P450
MQMGEFDLRELPRSFYEDPYPTYRLLRESDPVHRLPDGSYFLSRYADLERVYRDTTTFSSDKKVEFRPKYGDTLLYEHHTTSLVFNDPPLHKRVRGIIAGALTPRAIADTEPGLISLVDRLIANIAERGRADLIDYPDLITTGIEEVLRFESSNQLGNRATTTTVEVGGIAMGPGTRLNLCIGAANRDPAQFPDPERFDLSRTPNRHLAFAGGPHQCIGMNLARFPNYRLAREPVRGGRARFRGFLSLPVVVS